MYAPKDITINVGSLGTISLPKGVYAYIGSASLPKNPIRRIIRHFMEEKKIRWHIDYLTSNPDMKVRDAYICWGLSEDQLYNAMLEISGITPAVRKFGCSDRRKHITHLFRIEDIKAQVGILEYLTRVCPRMVFISK
jgi:Uri superfamily endonuclease